MNLYFLHVFVWCAHLDLLHPVPDVEKAALRGYVIQEQHPMGFAEIRPCNAPEPLEVSENLVNAQQWDFLNQAKLLPEH